MKLKQEQRMIVWQWNNHSKPIRYIVDCSKNKTDEMERFMVDTNIIDEFKDQPKVLKDIMEKIEYDISCEQYCYYSERDQGGMHEIENSDAGKRELINLFRSKDWKDKYNEQKES